MRYTFIGSTLLAALLALPVHADVVAVQVLQSSSTSNLTAYTTASHSLPADTLCIACFDSHVLSAPTTVAPTISDTHGISWTSAGTVPFATIATPDTRTSCWWGISSNTGSTGTITFTTTAETQDDALWTVEYLRGADLSGTPVINEATNRTDSATSLTVTMSAFSDPENSGYARILTTGGATITAGTNYTLIGTRTMWSLDADATADASWSGAAAAAGIAFEVVDAKAPTPRLVMFSGSTTDASSYNTASWTPVANEPYLLFVYQDRLSGTPATAPTGSGNGLTWTTRLSVPYDTIAAADDRLTVIEGSGGSPSAGVTTIDFASETQTAISWMIVEFRDGCATGIIVSSDTDATDDTGDSSTALGPLSFAADENSAFVFAGNVGSTTTSGAVNSWDEIGDAAVTFRHIGAWSLHQTEWTNTWSANNRNAGIILELCSDHAPASGGFGLLRLGEP